MSSELEPAAIPLPESSDTFSLPPSSALRRSTRSSSRPVVTPASMRTTRSSRRLNPDIDSDDLQTPAPATAFDPKHLETPYEEETPRPRTHRRVGGGKYHPGQRPSGRAVTRETTPESPEEDEGQGQEQEDEEQDECGSPRSSNGFNSEEASDLSDASEGSEDVEFDDMDRTIKVSTSTPLAHQLPGFTGSTRARRQTGRSSPGRTPAKKLLGRSNDYTVNLTTDFTQALEAAQQRTPRSTDFENTNLPPSMFADIQKTPFLSQPSPYKNANNHLTELDQNQLNQQYEDQMDHEPMDSDRAEQDKEWENQEAVEEFFNFSPQKNLPPTEHGQLSIKKRRSPPEEALPKAASSPPPVRRTSRSFKQQPVHSVINMFESIAELEKPIVSVEERKAAKRRRQTAEFRAFSAIDLEGLKSFLPPTTVSEEAEEEAGCKMQEDTQEKNEEASETTQMNMESHEAELERAEEALEGAGSGDKPEDQQFPEGTTMGSEQAVGEKDVEAQDTSSESKPDRQPPPEAVQDNSTEAAGDPMEIEEPPIDTLASMDKHSSPEPTQRAPLRRHRSNSCPPQLIPESEQIPTRESQAKRITALTAKVAELEELVEKQKTQIRVAQQATSFQMRRAEAAEETVTFLQAERRFGVCCKHAPGWQPREEKLGRGAIQLPSSPPVAAAPEPKRVTQPAARRPVSRMAAATATATAHPRPESRLRERPASRVGIAARQAATANYAIPTATSVASRKRVRDEQPARNPAPKRVLSASSSERANALMNKNTVSGSQNIGAGLSKKPEKPVRPASRLARAEPGVTSARGLARGARR